MVKNQNNLLKSRQATEAGTALYGGDVEPNALVEYDPWGDLKTVKLNEKHLVQNRIISSTANAPAHAPFDVLRTRLLQTLKDNGWSRVAITSPTNGCGKTFVAANLAFSLSRRAGSRTVLLDMDLRNPGLAKTIGISHPGRMRNYLSGRRFEKDHLFKVNSNLVLGLNASAETDAAEILQDLQTNETLEVLQLELQPDIILFDMPSVLHHDEVLSFLPQVDGVLLVIGGGLTKAAEVKQVEKLLHDQVPLLGVILNHEEGPIGKFFGN